MEYRAGTKRKQTRSGRMACTQSRETYTTQVPVQINQQHKLYIVAPYKQVATVQLLVDLVHCSSLKEARFQVLLKIFHLV